MRKTVGDIFTLRWAVALQILVPLLLGALLARCGGGKTAPAKPLALVVSGDTDGWITPCGCTANQSGGLLRRATYLDQQREHATVLYADAGGAPAGTSAYQKLRFESILAGEREMDIVAHNLGGPEVALGAAYLRDVAMRSHMPFVSANLRDSAGDPVAPSLVVVSANERRIAFVGVLSARYATASVRVLDPLATVRDVIAAHRGEFDTLVVLAYMHDEELLQFAAALPEADAVIGGPTGQSIVPKLLGPTILAAATKKGKFLVHIDIPAPRTQPWSGDVVELTPVFADDPPQQQNVTAYLAALRKADFISTQTQLVPDLAGDAGLHIAGSSSCVACHAREAEVWRRSGHAHAWQTLVGKGREVDPSCQVCHTTGYGLPGGFVSASRAARVDVGCEDCHGPSEAHVRNPQVHTLYRAADQCLRCHDAENSPTFNFAVYWPKIAHGKPVARVEGGAP